MHEIDRGVGFQQVAPGALAGMRLAGDEQHAQLVAHAVDRDDRAVVDRRQFAFHRRGFDLDDIGAGMRDRDLHAHILSRRDVAAVDLLAVAAHGDAHRTARGALILDAEGDHLRLPDNAEARRRGQHHAAVALVGLSGDQRMNRRGEAERGGVGRHVMHAAVGDEEGAGDAVRRHVGEDGAERIEQARAVGLAVGLAGFGDAHFEAGNAAEPLGQRDARVLGLLGALAEILARALVDDDGGDRRDRIAVLAGEGRIGEREHEQSQRERADHRAAAA